MTCLGCKCGNRLSNSCDGQETEYYFIPKTVLDKHWEDRAFFEIQYSELTTEIWKCDICDRMMFFDNYSAYVTRSFKQIEAEAIPTEVIKKPHIEGLCYNNLIFNEVDWYFTHRNEQYDEPDYIFFNRMDDEMDKPLLSPKVMFEEVFSGKNGRFRDWWYASLYDDYLIFYSPYREEWTKPVRAWKCYKHTIFDEEGKPIH